MIFCSPYSGIVRKGFLEAIGSLRTDIHSVSIISSGKVLETWSRNNDPIPASDDLKRMLLQVDVFTSMPATNEKLHGKVQFLIISHEKINAFLIPLDGDATLVVAFMKRHNYEDLLEKTLALVNGS